MKKFGLFWTSNRPQLSDSGRLLQAIAATKAVPSGPSALSDRARGHIAEALAAAPRTAPRTWAAPFLPLPRLAVASALPVVAGLLLLSFGTRGPAPLVASAATMFAAKDGNQVRFTLGEAPAGQRVFRSTVPQGQDRGRRVAVRGGSFRDALDDQASIVFYRVE